MKHLQNSPPIHFSAAGVLALLLILGAYATNQGEKAICSKVQTIFESVIIQDCNKRWGMIDKIHKPLGRKVKHVNITIDDKKETIHLKDSVDEAIANQMFFQHIMMKEHPIHPDTFNILLKKELAEHGIYAQATGVIYQNKGKKQYSDNDFTGMQSAFVTEEIYIDIRQQASVQAWVKYSLYTIVGHIPSRLKHSILIGMVVLAGTMLYTIVRKERKKQKSLHAALQEENEQYKAKEAVRAAYEKNLFGDTWQFEGMTLYQRTRTIHADGISCTLTPNEFRLLWMFVTTPGNILYRTDIQDAFWPGYDTAANNMHGLIKHLRDSLKDFPDYQLKSLKEHQFKLIVGKKNNKKPADD